MASQNQLRTMFNGMSTAQKGNFITNMKKSVDVNDNSENALFLKECIEVYNKELEAGDKTKKSDGSPTEVASEAGLKEPAEEAVTATEEEGEPEPEPPEDNELKIDNITNEIYGLADNIRYNINIIDTISSILSGEWKELGYELAKVETPAYESPTGDSDSVTKELASIKNYSDYESKIIYIEGKITELSESIRHDINVIETISKLLSGGLSAT